MPREEADELRDADSEPCPVCDVLPHRQKQVHQMTQKQMPPALVVPQKPFSQGTDRNWFARLLAHLHPELS